MLHFHGVKDNAIFKDYITSFQYRIVYGKRLSLQIGGKGLPSPKKASATKGGKEKEALAYAKATASKERDSA